MDNNELMYSLLAIFSPLIAFFLLKIINFRAERVVCEFNVALKENSPRSYVTQRKLIKVVRRFSGLITGGKIYWAHYVGNYLQCIVVIFPLFLFLLHLLFGINEVVFKILNFCVIILVLWSFFISIVTVRLCFRCKKIKKTNPKYSNCELKDW